MLKLEAGGLWPISAFALFQILLLSRTVLLKKKKKNLGLISWPPAFSVGISQMHVGCKYIIPHLVTRFIFRRWLLTTEKQFPVLGLNRKPSLGCKSLK